MKKNLVVGAAVVVVLVLILWMRPSHRDAATEVVGESDAAGAHDSTAMGERGSASRPGGGSESGRQAAMAGRGSSDEAAQGGGSNAIEARRGEAIAVRNRLAAAGSRAAAHGTGGGFDGDGGGEAGVVDGSRGDAGEQQAAMRPKANQNVQNGQNPADTTTEAGGEAVPEVAYNGGVDKSYGTQTQTQLSDVGKIGGEAGTVSFWVKPAWGAGNQDDANFVQLGDSSLHFAKNVNYMRFEYFDKGGAEQGVGFNIGDWKDGDWHQVAGSWNGRTYELFIDGKPVSQNTFPQPPDFQNETQVLVGSNFSPGIPAASSEVTGIQVLNRYSSPGEIAQQHQSGQRPH